MGFPSVRIVICEAGIGNVRSVVRAVERVTNEGNVGKGPVEIVVSGSPTEIAQADFMIVPGQGAFASFARAMKGGLGEALVTHIEKGKPYLGICLGMQVLFEESEEAPGERGLGVFAGQVRRLSQSTDPTTGEKLRLPHVGWNAVVPTGSNAGAFPQVPQATTSAQTESAPPAERHFYFAHSYVVVPTDASLACATTDYGAPFVSSVAKDNVLGVQFHPEKSQTEGLALLDAFFRR